MDINNLRRLSKLRLVNMQKLYTASGLSPTNITSRAGRKGGKIKDYESFKLKNGLIDIIITLLRASGMSIEEFANAIMPAFGGPAEYFFEKRKQEANTLTPVAYIYSSNMIKSVYIDYDRFRSRTTEQPNATQIFLSYKDFAETFRRITEYSKTQKIELTERGRTLLTHIQNGESSSTLT